MKKIGRREFTKISAAGVVAFGMGGSLQALAGSGSSELVVVEGELLKAAAKALDSLGGISRFVKRGQKVLLKPNISFASEPVRGANTDPELVAWMARQCVEAGAREVLVADIPLQTATLCLWRSGIKEAMAKVSGATLSYFSDDRFFKEVSIPQGKSLKKSRLLKPLLDSDVFINLPRAKTHNSTTVTLGLKNLMGVAIDRKSYHTQHDLHQAIADLASVVRPVLTLIDASRVMVDNGPGGPGTLVPLNTVVAGTNPVEVDAVMVSLTEWGGRKYRPEDIKRLKAASELGLGRVELSQIPFARLKV